MKPSFAKATEGGRAKPGQAMIETVLAVLVITFLFLVLFKLSQMLTGKIMLQHAAMRVARARAVGMNEFMCIKAGRVSVIPVAGKRLQPGPDDERKDISETALARMYMRTLDWSYADGLLRYENWEKFTVRPGHGGVSSTEMKTDWFDLRGEAEVDTFPAYMNDLGI